jgi:hypothetical protein
MGNQLPPNKIACDEIKINNRSFKTNCQGAASIAPADLFKVFGQGQRK